MGDVQPPLEAIRIIVHLNTARYHSFHQRLVTVNLRAERLCAHLESKYRDGAVRAKAPQAKRRFSPIGKPGTSAICPMSSVVRLILDGTVVRVRLDKKATSILLLVVNGIREDGQKVP